MGSFIKLLAELVNNVHDIIEDLFMNLGINLTDKDLHFWIIGVIGITFFLFTHLFFKWLSKFSITVISFLYTFTVMLVIVFAIEIQQKITGRGRMEFSDAIIGLYGFLAFFAVFLLIKTVIYFLLKLINRPKKERSERSSRADY
ncbi:hypothetical protein KUV80_10515 [Fictibacillus nanhaiensis]|uniref:hypothetical protein n=1 Tax=Fictibacillus nanhaiensis TaxID=742169 RepID=UPI001C95C04C|nr:hypothetical protein [Fictibacillus nanhaiensis]MBY6037092.1 hypothetical protein [Fictibacillus nanhaiensis]